MPASRNCGRRASAGGHRHPESLLWRMTGVEIQKPSKAYSMCMQAISRISPVISTGGKGRGRNYGSILLDVEAAALQSTGRPGLSVSSPVCF